MEKKEKIANLIIISLVLLILISNGIWLLALGKLTKEENQNPSYNCKITKM